MTWLRIAPLVSATALVLVLTGCTAPAPPVPPAPGPRVIPVGAEDRDEETMKLAAAQLDPCALADPDVLSDLPDAELTPGRTRCDVGSSIVIKSYERFGFNARYQQQPIDLAGMIGYRSSEVLDICTISVPLSFAHALSFSQRPTTDDGRNCDDVEALATAAARKLSDDPAALRRDDLSDAQPACDGLAEILGDLPVGTEIRAGEGTDELSECGLWEIRTDGFQSVTPEYELELDLRPEFEEWRSAGGWQDNEVREVDGTDVLIVREPDPDSGDDRCTVSWDAQPASQEERVIGVMLSAPTCALVWDRFDHAVQVLGDYDPDPTTVGALVYRTGESDNSAVGPCVHVWGQEAAKCAPAVPAQVPEDPVDLVSRGALSPDLICSATAPAAHELFGPELQATTLITIADPSGAGKDRLGCRYVREDQTLTVDVTAVAESTVDDEDWLIAGHPAAEVDSYSSEDNIRTTQVAVATEEQLSEDDGETLGMLQVTTTALPERSQGYYQGVEINRTPLELHDQFVERLTDDLLN